MFIYIKLDIKTRGIFKKITDTERTFHAKMSTIKDRNCGPNRCRRYQEEVARIHRTIQKKTFNDPDNHNGVITHLEPAILECEVRWVLRTITMNKTSGGDGI